MNEKVSVIIPNYNSEKTIKLCLDSVYNQNYFDIEVIVVDDGSTDHSIDIINEYPCTLYKTPKNSGPSIARNIGASKASGEILFFLDSDVALDPEAVSNAIREFDQDASIGCVCGIYDKVPLIRDSIIEEYRILQGYYWRKSSEGIVTPAFFSLGAIRKDVFYEIGEFNTQLRNSEDADYGHRLSKKYKLLLTSKIIGRHDDIDKFTKIVSILFERGRTRVPLYIKRKKFMKGFETANRAIGVILAGFSILTLPLMFLHPLNGFISLLFFLLFLVSDYKMYIFVFKEKRVLFGLFFIFLHFIINLFVFLGIAKGTFDWLCNKNFRDSYLYQGEVVS